MSRINLLTTGLHTFTSACSAAVSARTSAGIVHAATGGVAIQAVSVIGQLLTSLVLATLAIGNTADSSTMTSNVNSRVSPAAKNCVSLLKFHVMTPLLFAPELPMLVTVVPTGTASVICCTYRLNKRLSLPEFLTVTTYVNSSLPTTSPPLCDSVLPFLRTSLSNV